MAQHINQFIELTDRQSPESFALLRRWLQQCQCDPEHWSCARYFPVEVPSRLVQISALNEPLSARLYSPRDENDVYIALSYCWGGPQQYATTRSSVDDYYKQLPFDSMPATIKDAIQVTRECGYRYLWVDALCIIQDDPEDLKRELPRMRMIYENADMTISAACAATATDGFLATRLDRLSRLPVSLCRETGWIILEQTMPDSRSKEDMLRLGEPLNHPLRSDIDLEELSADADGKASNKKQTKDMGKEIDVRRRSGVLESRWNDLAIKFGYQFYPIIDQISLQTIIGMTRLRGYQPTERILYQGWLELVETYTSRQLTKESDILIAISALAELFSCMLPGGYIAGIWERDFIAGLSWTVHKKRAMHMPARRMSQYQAPSWSWASLIAPVHFDHVKAKDPVAHFVKCSIGLVDRSIPFGAVFSGELVVEALVLKGKLQGMSYSRLSESKAVGLFIQEDVEDASPEGRIFVLLALWEEPERGGQKMYKELSGLLLESVSGSGDVYQRRGWFATRVPVNEAGLIMDFSWSRNTVRII
ncbi:hypothetical protein N0V90_012016 [Kalmusia sp. IMI 367209]|nr:hypothetical protein N0V90_012016 [Kalmusia sp. IMI 367209]